ncbi:MAG: hypothetical protein WCQ65_09390 [Fermentimonas sp.]
MSKLQIEALETIEKIMELGKDRPFTQCEIPGANKHTTRALVNKGFLELVEGPLGEYGPEYFIRTDKQVE